MNIEEECCACGDPDYGVFGDNTDCPCPCHSPPLRRLSPRDKADIARQRKRQEDMKRTSREFNSYMIDLFNESPRK